MRRLVCLAVAALCAVSVASAAFAYPEYVEEVWRSPGGHSWGLTSQQVDERDGSVWLIEGANVTHWSPDGTLLARSRPLSAPRAVTFSSFDGSCWVWQEQSDGLVHLGADASLLSVTPGFGRVARLTASPYDGSLWVNHFVVGGTPVQWIWYLSHVSASGQELSRWEVAGETPYVPGVAVDPTDGSIWAVTEAGVVRARADGTRLWEAPYPGQVIDFDPRDQSLWVAYQYVGFEEAWNTLTHLSSGGQVLWQSTGMVEGSLFPSELHVSHLDGSVWLRYPVVVSGEREVAPPADPVQRNLHLDSSGALLAEFSEGLDFFNDLDGSVWASTSEPNEEIHISAQDQEIGRFARGYSLDAYDQGRSTFWGLDHVPLEEGGGRDLLRVGSDGSLLWRQHLPWLRLVGPTVNAPDGSVWAMDPHEMIRFSPEGEELERRPPPAGLAFNSGSLSVSPTDGSWWVTSMAESSGQSAPLLTHYAPDGSELSQTLAAGWEPQISPYDGSAWAVWNDVPFDPNTGAPQGWRSVLSHVASDGTLLLQKEYSCFVGTPVVWADGSAWIDVSYSEGRVLEHWSDTGELLTSSPCPWLPVPADLYAPSPSVFAVSPADRSVYVLGAGTDPDGLPYHPSIERVAADGTTLWRQDAHGAVGETVVDPQDGSIWVTVGVEWMGSFVAHYAADGTELWRGATFNGPSDLSLDTRDGSVWVSDSGNDQIVHLQVVPPPFPDIAGNSWAFEAIAACAEAGIVQGYWDGYRPDQVVTRDQMAVYVSRALAGGDEGVQVPSGVTEPTFSDVDEAHWAYRYVEYCVGANIVEGFPDGGYHPDGAVNRGQMAVYIARALVTPSGDAALPDPPDAPTFDDVTAANDWAWCYPHVEYCAAEGIVQGYWDGYHPERAVTRDQMAVYIARAFQLPM